MDSTREVKQAHRKLSLLPLADGGIEHPEPLMTVALERAHVKFLSQGEGVTIVRGRSVGI